MFFWGHDPTVHMFRAKKSLYNFKLEHGRVHASPMATMLKGDIDAWFECRPSLCLIDRLAQNWANGIRYDLHGVP